jgi:hypothetical protein
MTARWIRPWVAVTMAGVLLLPFLGGGGRASVQQAQAVVVDLKLVEQKDPMSLYGFMADKDGKIERPFACPSGKLLMQFTGDKLRVDTNGDGVIDDKDAPAVQIVELPTQGAVPFKPQDAARVEVAVKLGGKIVQYPLSIRSQKVGDNRMVIIGAGAVLEGKFGETTIRIIDGNMDGRFGGEGDRVALIGPGEAASMNFGTPWSRVMTIGGKLHNVEMIGDAAQLKLTPYTGPVAEVQIEADKSVKNLSVMLQGTNQGQVGQLSGTGTAQLIPGSYRLGSLSYQVGEGNRAANVMPGMMSASHDAEKPPFELKAGKNVLKFGPPLTMDFVATFKDGTLDITAVKITGVAGELYSPSIQEPQGDSFASYISAGGKEQELAKLSFG